MRPRGFHTLKNPIAMSDQSSTSLSSDSFPVGSMETAAPRPSASDIRFAGRLADQLWLGGDAVSERAELWQRYRKDRVLAERPSGAVVLAHDERLDRPVVIKPVAGLGGELSAEQTRAFLEAAARLSQVHHPNLVPLLDYGVGPDGAFVVYAYVEGQALSDALEAGPIPIERVVAWGAQLCSGLSRAHACGLVHAAIHPANVLIDRSGNAQLVDFWLTGTSGAEVLSSQSAERAEHWQRYQPPEQRRAGGQGDMRSDQWSLAATLSHAITGVPPAGKGAEQGARAVAEPLQPVLAQAMHSSPQSRYSSVGHLGVALERAGWLLGGPDGDAAKPAGTGGVPAEGVCPSCGAVNDPGRKFCKSCASSLRVNCLGCGAGIPVWDEVCGECGARQSELMEPRTAELSQVQADAQLALDQHRYAEAEQAAGQLAGESDQRFGHFHLWGERFAALVSERRSSDHRQVVDAVTEARQHRAVDDLRAAVVAVGRIPEALRRAELPAESGLADIGASDPQCYRQQLLAEQLESLQLEREVHQRVADQQLKGLLSKIQRLLQLRPGRSDVRRLAEQLEAWQRTPEVIRDELHLQAVEAFEAHDYDACLARLAKIDPQVALPQQDSLQVVASFRQRRCAELIEQVEQAVAGNKLLGLLKPVQEYLELKPHDARFQKLRQQLEVRENQQRGEAAKMVKQAMTERAECEFDEAVGTLEKIPAHLLTGESTELLDECRSLAEQRGEVISKLKEARQSGQYAPVLETADQYRQRLEQLGLKDAGFVILMQPYNNRLKKRGQLKRGALVAVATVAAVGALWGLSRLSELYVTGPSLALALPDEGLPKIVNSIGMEMKLAPRGRFVMGSPPDEEGRTSGERQRTVTLTRPFFIAVYPVTQDQYFRVTGERPVGGLMSGSSPVEMVTWEEAVEFCRLLSELPEEQEAGRVYRLPTEAEWEYACRAGSETAYYFGDKAEQLGNFAWYAGNSNRRERPFPVGKRLPNRWGLFDMIGNTYEWCQDWHDEYPPGDVTDPSGPRSGKARVVRGGSRMSRARDLRSAYRTYREPDQPALQYGFRVVVTGTPANMPK
jgi:formylglycine-generating enzyme required for sulfatase activity